MARHGLRSIPLLLTALLPALLLGAACGSGERASPSETPVATPTAAIPVPSADGTLRGFDFEAPDFAADLIERAGGGEVHAERVTFADLTADGREEAVVVVESGGTAGDLGVAVFRLLEDTPELLFFQLLAGRVEVRFGLLVIEEGVYAAGEPQCCPSRLRELAYGWRDGEFTLISDQVIDNPQR